MAVLSRTSVILVFVCSIVGYAWCYSSGAPTAACVTMWPGHFANGQQINGQTGDSPYQVETDSTDFTSGRTVTVTVSADPGVTYKGFLLQARLVDSSSDTPVGVFRNLPNGVKTLACSSTDDSVTHSDSSFKAAVSVEWVAPNNPVGDIEFVATVVHSKSIFWRQLKSSALTALFPCDPNPCLNGGTCFQAADGQSYFCGCVDPANKNPNCEDQCNPNPCLNGGVCYRSATSSDNYFCQCSEQFQGINCETAVVPCSPNPCQNRGICQESGDSFTCFCPADHYGPVCENLIIPCSTNPCLNDATCTDTGTGHQCTCAMGWSGTDCGTNLFCMPDSCMNGGTCFDSNPAGSEMFYCQCTIYYTGSRCETADPCRASPCANGGVCSQTDDTTEFSCTCPDGFEGDLCETTSNPCQSNPCLNGGLCYRSNEGNSFCLCTEDYTGEICDTMINPCMLPTTPCLNGATCVSGSGTSYECQCPSAYSGMHCETLVDPCQSNPCVNGGTCESEQGVASYTCSCPVEYFGSNCQNRGVCFEVTCNNRGNCVPHEAQTMYTCNCTEPYDGRDCQYENMCESNNQCSEGSTCRYLGQSFVECVCPEGLTGQFCDLDVSCNGNPCRNGGTCMPTGGGNYECKCGAAYSGANCETYTNPCVPNPCVHGTCRIDLQLPIGRECMCNENYMGVNCSVYDGNPCDVVECDNGGTCIDSNSTAVCVCTMEYAGLRCETPTHPVFNGCPSGVSPSFPMIEGSNQAYIDLLITATDQEGRNVPLVVTDGLSFPSTIVFTEEYREGKMIEVVAEDDEGRKSTCEFTLRIFDNEVPSLSCPSDVSAITTGDDVAVTWPMATATDNFAITDPLQYSPSNGSEFSAGESTVIVKGLDTFDNQGQCTFKVTVHKKASDCTAFTGPDNGKSSCDVVGDQRMCTITCNDGFGNAIGDEEYTCIYETTAKWDPRPNTDICVPFKPGNGVNRVATIQFSIDSTSCNAIDFVSSVKNSLTSSLESLGICDPTTSSISCEIGLACENTSGRRRKRAPTDLNVDISLMSLALNGDSNSDVQMRLDDAVSALMTAAASGSLSIEVDGQTINNEPTAFDLSDNTWSCKPGQISSSDGCLSCPPGSFHNIETNKCEYCPLSTYQNKPEQDSCVSCPEGTMTQQTGAYSADLCGPTNKPQEGPWTPTLIAIVSAAGGLIVLLLIILACVYIVKCSRRSSDRADSGKDPDGPLSNFTHLNRAYEEEGEEPEMQFHGGPSMTSDTTYQNVEDDVLDTGSTDHLVRIPSLSQYSDFYASVKARSAPVPDSPPPPPPVAAPEPPVANGGPPSPPPAPPAPPASDMNMNNSNTSTSHTYQNGTIMNGGSKAKFQV